MEGGQAVPPPTKPRFGINASFSKRTLAVMIAAVAVVAILVIIVVANPSLLGGSNSGGGDMFKNPQVGDYIVYEGAMGMTTRIEVTAVKATEVTILQTTFIMGESVPVYQNVTKEEAFRSGQYNPYNIMPGWSVDSRGKHLVSTTYGARNCDHFTLTNSSQGMSVGMDVYLYKGVLVKVEMTAGPITLPVISLTETNLNVIVLG